MANNFTFVISATDRATNVVRRINSEFSRQFRPLTNLYRAAARLGREIGKNPIARGMLGIGRAVAGVAAGIARVAAPMAALIGVGSIAGVAALAMEWGRMGFEVSKTSAGLGMVTSDLQSLRGAANLAGVSTETLTAGLKSVGDTMQDALGGRNQSALLMLNKIGVGIHKTAGGSIDVARGFKDIAAYIASIKSAQVQGLVARQFGLEGAIPLLRKGAKGIEEYQRRIAELGGVSTAAGIAAGEQFGLSLNYMTAAAGGLKIAIGSALMPALLPLVEQFTKFVSLNREAIGLKIGEWAGQFGKWLGTVDFEKVADGAARFGRSLAYIVENIAALMKFGGRVALRAGASADHLLEGFGFWRPDDSAPARQPGLPQSGQPVGIRNNNPGNLRDWGGTIKRDGFAAFDTPDAGLSAMIKNLQAQQSKHGLNTIAGIISKWAPPSENNTPAYIADVEKRTGLRANQPLDLSDKKTVAPLISAIIAHEGNGAGYSKSMVEDAVQKVVVEFKNAPPGTRATASTRAGNSAPVRVNHAMPTLAAG